MEIAVSATVMRTLRPIPFEIEVHKQTLAVRIIEVDGKLRA